MNGAIGDPLSDRHRRDYSTTDFERIAGTRDGGLDEWEQDYVRRYFDPRAPTLEVGSGGGRVVFALERAEGFTDVTAIDFVERLVDASAAAAARTGSRVTFRVGNALALDFPDESFPQVLAVDVLLSHFPRRDLRMRVLAEIRRVMAPGGLLMLNVHNVARVPSLRLVRWLTKAARLFGNRDGYWSNDLPRLGARSGRVDLWFLRRGQSHLHYYYPAELMYDVLNAGFTVMDLNGSDKAAAATPLREDFHRFPGSKLHLLARK